MSLRAASVVLVLASACASSSKPAPVVATPEGEACGAQIEDSQPGNQDRFSFATATGERYGYKDGHGAVVIEPRFGYAYEFNSGGIAAAVERPTDEGGQVRFVFIDASGQELAVAYPFDNGPDYFQEGVARILDGDQVGFIDRTGAIVIAPQFAGATGFCHGRASVHDGASEWEIDPTGKAVTAKRPHVEERDPCGEL